jgi:indole-3-glycerol phosphate synthase
MSGGLLEAVVAAARRAAHERELAVDRASLESAIAARSPAPSAFRDALTAPGVRIIAECKRRSPSRGVLRPEYDPVAIARGYEACGAAAVSVLTEPTFFDGSIDHLRQVRAAVRLPLLRKDFIVTEYQIAEAAVAGADAVLLIVAALDSAALRRLIDHAARCGLAALVEVHDRGELDRALDAGATLVGVNSRNLRTLQVDPDILDDLGAHIPESCVAVAESGLRTASDLSRLGRARYDAFLIGERFMTEPSPEHALEQLLRAAEAAGVS